MAQAMFSAEAGIGLGMGCTIGRPGGFLAGFFTLPIVCSYRVLDITLTPESGRPTLPV